MTAKPAMLALSDIDTHPANVRHDMDDEQLHELAQSLRAQGMLQPILVTAHAGRYRLPAVVRDDMSDADVVAAMLIENLQRAALNPIEEAQGLASLRDALGDVPQTDLARHIGRTPYWVGTRLMLLELTPEQQARVASGKLPVNEAEDLVVAKRRVDAGKAPDEKASRGWGESPWHLSKEHPLAPAAKHVCDALGHTGRRRLQGHACGSCWEEAIRADERRQDRGAHGGRVMTHQLTATVLDGAACTGADLELFFPGPGDHGLAARRICLPCPVRPACLQIALDTDADGIWGGTGPRQRRDMPGRQLQGRGTGPCGTDPGYKAHLKRGEQACEPCLAAHRARQQQRKEARP